MSIVALRGGLRTTVQDLGHAGYGRYGVPERGALDPLSLRLANMVIGNPPDAAGLEMTLDGAHLLFEHAATIAVCGADMTASVEDRALGQCRPIDVGAGVVVRFGQARVGARAYLAIGGGIDVPLILGSRGTHLRARFGGLDGRAIRSGDRIVVGAGPVPAIDDGEMRAARWRLGRDVCTPLADELRVRVITMGQGGFDRAMTAALLARRSLTVSAASDRMGLRFEDSLGEHDRSITSEPAAIGALQLPPDGRPIVLMNDHQTTGGYPVIAYVATVDLPTLGQARPGARVLFEGIDVDGARRLLCERERDLRRLSRWIQLRRAR